MPTEADVDLNLLVALDALLAEGSVTAAARRLGLSSSAMSRTLARLRAATGDPLLVRAGRGLVPTPRAVALRDRVHRLTRDACAVLRPQLATLDLASLALTFTIRASEGFVERFAGELVGTITRSAPRVRIRFAPKPDKDARALREGTIDLEIGVLGASAPEVRRQALFRDDFIGIVRAGHPLVGGKRITPARYAACKHVVASRKKDFTGPVDDALAKLGLERTVVAVVPGYPDAMRIALHSELVGLVPRSCLDSALPGLASFALPVRTPGITVSAMWHPRADADPAQRWLRDTVLDVCRRGMHKSRIVTSS